MSRRGCPCPAPKEVPPHRTIMVADRAFQCCPGSRMRRNLSYFVYPLKGSIWGWNVDQLRPFLPVFNGRKIVSVAEDEGTDPFGAVVDRLGDPSIEYVRAKNDPERKEMVTFLDVLGRLRSSDPAEMTFYAHAKGVSHWSSVHNIMAWARAMYVLNLADVGAVERIMEIRGAVGAFRENHPVWHFSGTFFWLKHSEIFSRPWEVADAGPMGAEHYPGRHIPVEMSFDLAPPRLYRNRYENPITEEELLSALDELQEGVHWGDAAGTR